MHSSSASSVTDDLSFNAAERPGLSAVSWGAILAGAAAAAALSLILLFLGTGLGLSSASPWANQGISATSFGVSTILWISFTQLVASGLGGYLAGRLRIRWLQVHADEVYFRDTAHGLLAWAIATLATAALLGSVIGSIVHSGVQAGTSLVSGAATTVATAAAGNDSRAAAEKDNGSMGYFVDSLFRTTRQPESAPTAVGDPVVDQRPDAEPATAASSAEVTRIFMQTLRTGPLSPADLSYVGDVVAGRTGLPQQEAEERVRTLYAAAQGKLQAAETAARTAADEARKA
ncbi:MAG: hypothetical protein M3O62_06315, partial [Pseudomonadota bacterium]|nr:hypothetical protein [Pseudomonadota bacterium]